MSQSIANCVRSIVRLSSASDETPLHAARLLRAHHAPRPCVRGGHDVVQQPDFAQNFRRRLEEAGPLQQDHQRGPRVRMSRGKQALYQPELLWRPRHSQTPVQWRSLVTQLHATRAGNPRWAARRKPRAGAASGLLIKFSRFGIPGEIHEKGNSSKNDLKSNIHVSVVERQKRIITQAGI
jgi:hypothetical protein